MLPAGPPAATAHPARPRLDRQLCRRPPWTARPAAATRSPRRSGTHASAAPAPAAAEPTPTLRQSLTPPPPSFDVARATLAASRATIAARFPSLADLVEEGTLVALPRPPSYVERRADGYAEPALILVVATAHLSDASPAAVARVIGAARPDAVVVELCRSRTGLLAPAAAEGEGGGGGGGGGGGRGGAGPAAPAAKAANPWALSGSLARSAELGGPAAMAARVVLARWAAGAAAAAAAAGGGGPASLPTPRLGDDARAAAAAARAVGAALVLGDRPIEITLSRAWAALPWRDRLAAGLAGLGGVAPATASRLMGSTTLPTLLAALAAVEGTAADGGGSVGRDGLADSAAPAAGGGVAVPAPSSAAGGGGGGDGGSGCPAAITPTPATPSARLDALRTDPAALAALVSALDAASPALAGALIHERDEWLAWSAARSRAVCGAGVVVAVLGAGHVRGVVWHLLDVGNRPLFKELAGQGVGRRAARAAALKKFGLETAAVSGAWAAWEGGRAAGWW